MIVLSDPFIDDDLGLFGNTYTMTQTPVPGYTTTASCIGAGLNPSNVSFAPATGVLTFTPVSGGNTNGVCTFTNTVKTAPAFTKIFTADSIAVGGVSSLMFTIDNSGLAAAANNLDFTDNLPAAITVATPANASTTCTGGTLTSVSGTSVVSYTGGTVACRSKLYSSS